MKLYYPNFKKEGQPEPAGVWGWGWLLEPAAWWVAVEGVLSGCRLAWDRAGAITAPGRTGSSAAGVGRGGGVQEAVSAEA